MAVVRDILESIHQRRSGPNPGSDLFSTINSFKLSPAEIALSVTPTDFSYPADPWVDPRRYGADPTNNPATATLTTTAVQTAINVAYQNGNAVWIGAGCKYRINPVSLTMTGSATAPLRIMGSSQIGSALIAVAGTSTPLLTFTTSTPNVGPIQAYLQIQNLSIASGGIVAGGHGLTIIDLAMVLLDNVRITNFDRNFDIQNCLTITLRECGGIQGNYGFRIALFGTFTGAGYPTTNLIKIDNCVANLNLIRGIEYNGGTGLFVRGCDIESNGTAVVCTANPAITATSATLTANWPFPTGAYLTAFPDGETRTINFTLGSTAISWSGGLAATQSAAYITPTGGVFVLGQCSPDLQEGHVSFEDTWFESNQMQVFVAAQTAGAQMRTDIKGCEMIAAANGQQILIAGSNQVLMESLQSVSAGDTYNVTANYATIRNVIVISLLGSNIGVPVYENVITASGGNPQTWGRSDVFTATLTGCTTSPTQNVQVAQQGGEVTLIFSQLTATSNSTSCTLTGLPAKYQPIVSRNIPVQVIDNGNSQVQLINFSPASGTMILFGNNSPTGFTVAGSKGIGGAVVKYRIDV